MSFLKKAWKSIKGWLIPDLSQEKGFNLEKSGTNQAIPVYYGKYKQAPCIKVFKLNSDKIGGAWNDYIHFICIICEGEIGEFGTVYFDGISEAAIDNERYHIERYTGADNQPFCATLNTELSQWKTTAELNGIGYLYVRLFQNKDTNWWDGEPKITVDINQGMLIKDLRDNVVKYSNNLALCTYDYATNTRYGRGMAIDKLLTQSFIDDANFIETERTYTRTIWRTEYDPETRTWIRYAQGTIDEVVQENLMSCNARLDTDTLVKDNLNILLKGMRANLPESEGQYRLSIEKGGAPVYAFTKNNLVGAIESDGGSQNDRYNQVIIKFRNRLTGEMDEAIFPQDNALFETWLTEDGWLPGEDKLNYLLLGEFTFETIDNTAEALQMGHVICHRSRQDIKAKFQGMPETIVVEAGDIVSLDSVIDGWNAKPFRVVAAEQNLDTGEMDFQAEEHQDSIYPWAITDVTEEYADTSFALPSSILTPTGLNYVADIDVSKNIMGVLSWIDPNDALVTTHYVEIINTNTNSLVFSQNTNLHSIDIPRLVANSYTARVTAKNALFASLAANLILTSLLPAAPDGLAINAGNFELILTPTFGGISGNLLCELKASNTTDIATAVSLGRDTSFIDNNLPPLTNRYYWVKSINTAGESPWSGMFTGITTNNESGLLQVLNGLEQSNFSADVKALLDQVSAVTVDAQLSDIINNIKVDILGLENTEAIVFNDYKKIAVDAITEVTAAALRDFQLVEYRNEIAAWKITTDEDIQQLTLETGIILPSEWLQYKLTVDGQTGTLTSLSTKQTEHNGVLETHTSQLIQTADRITFLEESTSFGDVAAQFNSVQFQLDGQANAINQQATSIRISDVDLINQLLSGALTAADLVDLDIDLSVAKKSISALTDENQSLAQSSQLLIAQFEQSSAAIEQTSKGVANNIAAQAVESKRLTANINDESSNRQAEINIINQVIVDETSARATAITAVEASIANESGTRAAAITATNQAVADESSARATAITAVEVSITTESGTRAAAITATNQAVATKAEQNALAALITRVEAEEGSTAEAFIVLNSHNDAINGLSAQSVLGVNINGKVAGVYVNGSATLSNIDVASDVFRLVHPTTGAVYLSGNATTKEVEFGGLIKGGKVELDDSGKSLLMNQGGFLLWYGLTTAKANPSRANAIWFLDNTGQYKKDVSRKKAVSTTFATTVNLTPANHFVISNSVEMEVNLSVYIRDSAFNSVNAKHTGTITATVKFYDSTTLLSTISRAIPYAGWSISITGEPSESETQLSFSEQFSFDASPSTQYINKNYKAVVTLTDTSSFIANATTKQLTAKFTTLEIA